MSEGRRERLLEAYRSALAAWRELIDGMADEDWAHPTGCPGWDVKDQLSHVVSVERIMLGDRGEPAELPDDLPHVRNEFGRSVEIGVQARRGTPPANLVAEAHETFDRRLAQLHELDPSWLDQEVDGPGPGMRMPGSRLLRTRTYDLTTHEYDVRRAVGRLTDAPGGAHLDTSVEQVVRAWSKVLPAALDRDGLLDVVVDGRPVARLHLDDGRRTAADDGTPADAVLFLTVAELLALAGGRDDAPVADQIELRGEPALVQAVVAAAAFTP